MTVAELIAELLLLQPSMCVMTEYDGIFHREIEVVVLTSSSPDGPDAPIDYNGNPNPRTPFVLIQ